MGSFWQVYYYRNKKKNCGKKGRLYPTIIKLRAFNQIIPEFILN